MSSPKVLVRSKGEADLLNRSKKKIKRSGGEFVGESSKPLTYDDDFIQVEDDREK